MLCLAMLRDAGEQEQESRKKSSKCQLEKKIQERPLLGEGGCFIGFQMHEGCRWLTGFEMVGVDLNDRT